MQNLFIPYSFMINRDFIGTRLTRYSAARLGRLLKYMVIQGIKAAAQSSPLQLIVRRFWVFSCSLLSCFGAANFSSLPFINKYSLLPVRPLSKALNNLFIFHTVCYFYDILLTSYLLYFSLPVRPFC